MLDQSHATVARPALLIVVAHYVLVVRVRILRQESLNQVTRVLLIKLENDVNLVDVAHVESDGMANLSLHILEAHESLPVEIKLHNMFTTF